MSLRSIVLSKVSKNLQNTQKKMSAKGNKRQYQQAWSSPPTTSTLLPSPSPPPQKMVKSAQKTKTERHLLGNIKLNINKCGSKSLLIGLAMDGYRPVIQLCGFMKTIELEVEDYWNIIDKLEDLHSLALGQPVDVCGGKFRIALTNETFDDVKMELIEISDENISLTFVRETITKFLKMQYLVNLKLNQLEHLEFGKFIERVVEESSTNLTDIEEIRTAAEKILSPNDDPSYRILLEEVMLLKLK